MTDSELIDNILNAASEVYELSDGDIRVAFRLDSVVYSIPLDEDVGTPFWKAIQAVLREYRTQLLHRLNEPHGRGNGGV